MSRFIVLTSEQAERVRGKTSDGSALEPVALANGTSFVLPEVVLYDTAHAKKIKDLISMPVREIKDTEWSLPNV